MLKGPFVYILAFTIFSLAAEQRKLHRLVGGHLRIIHPHSDESELRASASASGSKEKPPQKINEEEKKTLSQQVADGKYGLIQKELFTKPPKRQGIISYEENPEVPKDNINTLGGLSKNDIWLAENHLLVLRGGTYPPHDDKHDNSESVWAPIDDYNAPLHQVKIPKNPKIPPPFPVQLTEDGPLQILGTNTSRTLNGSAAAPAYALPPPTGWEPGTGPFFPTFQPPPDFNPAHPAAGQGAVRVPGQAPGEYAGGVPVPPFPLNGTWPPYFASLPPGAAILPPPGNQTDQFDDDDPSIYYPPPYSFYYPKGNGSAVQAGPLVPGIILPPPPNFFAPLEEETTTTKKPRHRKPTTTQAYPQIHPTTSPLPATQKTTKTVLIPARYPTYSKQVVKTTVITNIPPTYINEVKTTVVPKVVTIVPVRVQSLNRTYLPQRTSKPVSKEPTVTILRPVTTSTATPKVYVYNNNNNNNDVSNRPYSVYSPPTRTKTVISTTQVPLKYYTTANEIESNSVTHIPEKFSIGTQAKSKSTQKPPTQFYYYEEEPDPNSVTTPKPELQQNPYFDIPEQYYVPARPAPIRKPQPQYIYVTARPYNTQKPRYRLVPQPQKTDTFSIHIAKLQKQIHQYYTTRGTTNRPKPRPVYQYSFEAANYRAKHNKNFKPSPQLDDDDNFRPIPKYSVQIQPAVEIVPTEPPRYQPQTPSPIYQPEQENIQYYTTPRPKPYQYEEERYVATPKPITQYSFEATPNPVYQGYYTKPDEGYFDENTKQYFTVFGRKLPSGTSPIPSILRPTQRPNPVYKKEPPPNRYQQSESYQQYQQQNEVKPQYQKPISLESDTVVNYVKARPQINPDAELIAANQRPQGQRNYPQVSKYQAKPQYQGQAAQRDEGPEIVKAVQIEVPASDNNQGSYISYQLPGDDGAHFYFLTPQLAQRREQESGYYYERPSGPRLRREKTNNGRQR